MKDMRKKRLQIVLLVTVLVGVITTAVIAATRLDAGGEDEMIAAAKAQEALKEQEASTGKSGKSSGAVSGEDADEEAGEDSTGNGSGSASGKKSQTSDSETEYKGDPEGYLTFGGKEYCYYDDIETYLLMGTDGSGSNHFNAKKNGYGGDPADFIGLAVINRTKKTYTLLQIDRDTVANIQLLNADGSESDTYMDMQLCLSHVYGTSPEQNDEHTCDAVSDLLGGLDIDGYYTMGVGVIPKLNHAIGGVTVTIEDDFSKDDTSLAVGKTVHLSDKQAELYVRGRMSVGDGENTSRMRRQRNYIQAYYEEVMKQIKDRPGIINDLYKEFMSLADTDLSGNDVSRITNAFMTFENQGIKTIDGKHVEEVSEWDGLEHTRFLMDQGSLLSVMTEIFGLEEYSEESDDE